MQMVASSYGAAHGPEGWDDAQPKGSVQQPPVVLSAVGEIAGGARDGRSPAGVLDAGFGRCRLAPAALHRIGPQLQQYGRRTLPSAGRRWARRRGAVPKP